MNQFQKIAVRNLYSQFLWQTLFKKVKRKEQKSCKDLMTVGKGNDDNYLLSTLPSMVLASSSWSQVIYLGWHILKNIHSFQSPSIFHILSLPFPRMLSFFYVSFPFFPCFLLKPLGIKLNWKTFKVIYVLAGLFSLLKSKSMWVEHIVGLQEEEKPQQKLLPLFCKLVCDWSTVF